jgi:glycosyltransferase involved in cell wall biosynthesis
VLGFTRYLPRYGWSCTVVCAGEDDYWVRDDSLLARVPGETRVVRVSGGSGLSALLALGKGRGGRRSGSTFAGLRRLSDWWLLPDSYAGWARRAESAASRLLATERFDAMLSSSPPDSVHLAARTLHRRHRLPWVADFRDPWIPLAFREPPTPWHRARQAAMERDVLEGADLVLAASRTHADHVDRYSGARPRRVEHVPNGFEPAADSGGPAPAAATPFARLPEDAFVLAFTGTLSLMPDTEVFLDAVHDVLAARPDARRRLRVKLAGPYEEGYQDRAVALGLTGIVEFTGPIEHGASRALQQRADALLLWKPRHTPTMVPGKLYEYLDAGRPILAVLDADDEAAALVVRAGGEVVRPDDRVALTGAIGRRYDAWRATGRVPTTRPTWLEDHTRERLAGRLARLLDDVSGARA